MNRLSLLIALSSTPLLARCSSESSATPLPPSPQAQIRSLADAFASAWNVHDPSAFALTFAPTADFTNVYGVRAHGRPAIETFHAKVFGTVFKDSYQTLDSIDVLSTTAASAQVRVRWSMTGATITSWPPVQHGIISWTLVGQLDGSWLIGVMTNALAS